MPEVVETIETVDELVNMTGLVPVEAEAEKKEPEEEDKEKGLEKKPEEKETEEPASEAAPEENKPEDQHKGFQKRIDQLTREKKEAQEKANKLEKELAEKNEKKSEYVLTDEQMKEAVYTKATERIITEDKDKPLEERRILSADEIDELMLDSPGKFTRWDRQYGDFEKNLKKQIDTEMQPKEEKETPIKQQLDYDKFVKENPELDFMKLMKEIPKELFAEEKNEDLVKALKEKDEKIGNFFEFINKNYSKYPDPSQWGVAAKDYAVENVTLKTKSLEDKIKEQEAEIERLSSIDPGIRSTKPGSPAERKDNDVSNAVDSLLSRTPFGKK